MHLPGPEGSPDFLSASPAAIRKESLLPGPDSKNVSLEGWCVVTPQGVVVRSDDHAKGMLIPPNGTGEESRKLDGSNFEDWIEEQDRTTFASHFAEVEGTSRPAVCELRLKTGSHAPHWVSLVIAKNPLGVDSRSLVITIRDVREKKRHEEILRSDAERFAFAIGATRDGIWDWDIASGNVYFSPQWARLLGYEPDEIPQRVEFFYSVLHPDDVGRIGQVLEEHLQGKTQVKQDEVRLRTKSGVYRWFLDRGEVVQRDAEGKPIRMVGTITDITQRRCAEDALRESQARTRLLIEAASLGLWDWDLITHEVYFSPEWKRHLGYADDELPNAFHEWQSRLHPDDLERTLLAVRQFLEGERADYDVEFRLRHKDGSWRWIFARADVVRSRDGKPIRMMGCHLDITDRKEAEQSRDRSLSLMKATLESTADGILVVNSEGRFEIFNREFCKMWRVPDSLIQSGIDRIALEFAIAQLTEPSQFLEKVRYLYDHPFETSFDTLDFQDGRVFERYSCPQLIDGKVVGRVWSFRDVTERRQAEAAQAEALNRLQKIASRIPGVVYQYRLRPDGTSSIPYASEGIRDIFEIAFGESDGNVHFEEKLIDPEGYMASLKKSEENLTPWVHEFQFRRRDGSIRWLAGNSLPERESDGSTLWHGVVIDITERKEAESKLRDSERRLREAQAISQIGNFAWDIQSKQVTWSDQLYWLYGQIPSEFSPTFESYCEAIHPDDRDRVLQNLQVSMESKSAFDHEYRIVLEEGAIRWIRARGVAVLDAEGSVTGLEGTCQDITEQKESERAKESLETQLRESQKMEAIGTLAGGIAHDFNNILAAILGNVEVAQLEVASSQPTIRRCLEDIQRAGERARDLVQQILSFSRRKPTNRKILSLVPVIEEAARLLRATLPARLELEVQYAEKVPQVLADATQIEQVLLNLSTNAMQAMTGRRGKIRIVLDTIRLDKSVTDLHAGIKDISARSGDYAVRLRVIDDGPGMKVETQQRIFEPFFTTKPINEGTGLGLAVVHGIVQGHEGVITVESQPGAGATFTIYFPVAKGTNSFKPAPIDSPCIANAPTSQSKHILFLDDNTSVLQFVKQLLERRGYQVSCYSEQTEALRVLRADPSFFDLVVTDYNMPGMHGLEVAREVHHLREDLPVAITSGFIDDELRKGAPLCGVKELIAKPFTLDELFEVVQRLTIAV